MTSLNFLQRVVVVNVLRRVVKIDQYLNIAIRQKPIDIVRLVDALEIDKELDELAQRKSRKIRLVNHLWAQASALE